MTGKLHCTGHQLDHLSFKFAVSRSPLASEDASPRCHAMSGSAIRTRFFGASVKNSLLLPPGVRYYQATRCSTTGGAKGTYLNHMGAPIHLLRQKTQ